MAFFDSPKNKALWERELLKLDDERDRRKATGFRPPPAHRKGRKAVAERPGSASANPYVRRITLKELMQIEAEAQKARGGGDGNRKMRRRQKDQAVRSKRSVLE